MATDRPLHVVSVSIGSSTRDKSVEVTLGGRGFILERRGTDGDLDAARALIAELDGQVDVFGLGGIDLYLFAAGRRYTIRDAARLAAAARRTPVVDGSGLKAALEPAAVDWLEAQQLIDLRGAKALVVTAVDRFGLAETLAARAREICFGDLMFNVGLPVPIRSARTLAWVARAVLPAVVRLPFRWIYPIGEKQREITPRWGKWFAWADLIAGDWHMIHRYLPAGADSLAGKVILTNTTTSEDHAALAARGARALVTTTPVFDGRSFGTNVLEAALTAAEGQGRPLPPDLLLSRLREWGWTPSLVPLGPS